MRRRDTNVYKRQAPPHTPGLQQPAIWPNQDSLGVSGSQMAPETAERKMITPKDISRLREESK